MTTEYDVFNGDADGILSLIQWRKAHPADTVLVTGVKRDIQLLQRVPSTANKVNVFDVSFEKNAREVERLLQAKTAIFYADHHRAGNVPQHPFLSTHIKTNANICTGLIINEILEDEHSSWAVAAACGDNLMSSAHGLAQRAGLSEKQFEQCKQLGEMANYNGYGNQLSDLHYAPDALYTLLSQYSEPWHAVLEPNGPIADLTECYHQDMTKAQTSERVYESEHAVVLRLEDAPWSRRISGVYANACANQQPEKAHVIMTHSLNDTFTVSLRAPLNNKAHAGDICAAFPTGGGRAAAAGINQFKESQLPELLSLVNAFYGK